MSRVLGCVATEPVSLRDDLLGAENSLIRQAREHDSGWGMAVYKRGEGEQPNCVHFTDPAHEDPEFLAATELRGRLFNVHVRRATVGGLAPENTHPFCLGNYTFSHNGTVVESHRLAEPGAQPAAGTTDSELLFRHLMHDFDPARPVECLRHTVEAAIDRSAFSGLNLLFSDGERLYAYRLGVLELHWLARPGRLLVSSERLTEDERWHSVQQDVLLVLDPRDPEEPHAERLVGDAAVARADIREFKDGSELRGVERGEFASRRAARLAHSATE
jgi:glutamine amidotransferase